MPSTTPAAMIGLDDVVSTGLIDSLKDIYVEVTQLFTLFPVNIFL